MNDQVASTETAKILELAQTCTQLDGDFVEFGCYRGDTSVELAKILGQSEKKILREQNRPLPDSVDVVEGAVQHFSKSIKTGRGHSLVLPKDIRLGPAPRSGPRKELDCACKRLYAYDSFEGLPAKSPEDESAAGINFQPGVLHVSRHALIDKLKKHGLTNAIIKKAWFSDLTSQDLPKDIAFAFLDGDFYESQRTALALVQPRLVPQGIIVCHDYNNPELPGATQAVDEFLQQHPEYCLTVFQTLAILR